MAATVTTHLSPARAEAVLGWSARVAGAGLLGATAGIHLHLYTIGYKSIHVIGVLFLLNGIAASALCLAVLGSPRRLLGAVALLGAGLELGTLAGLLYTTHHELFGFRDSLQAPYAHTSIYVEVAGAVVLAIVVVLALNQRRRAHV